MASAIATVVAALIAASMIMFQLGRQHRNELARQEKAARNKLKLEIYQEFAPVLQSASEALQEAGGTARTSPMRASSFSHQVSLALHPKPVTDRAAAYSKMHFEASDRMADVILQLEKYLIVCPALDIFRLAFGSAAYDLGKCHERLFDFMLKHSPLDSLDDPSMPVVNVKVFDDKLLAEHDALCTSYANSSMDAICYLSDLQVELQMLLLGDLFPGNVVPRRRPADPSSKVVTLEAASVKSLRHHFLKNTEWGNAAVNTSMAVHRHFHQPNKAASSQSVD